MTTCNTLDTEIHAPGGNLTGSTSKRAAADPPRRPHGHPDGP